jgi:N-acetylmuramoyl-L-alanine amidase
MPATPATARRLLPIALAMLALASCTSVPQHVGMEGARWQPSPNFDLRRPNFVILHNTADDTADQALRTLTDPARKVSAHYLVARDGAVYQLVDERSRAWHAGVSSWGGTTDMNSVSLGIELDNNGHEAFPQVQIAALLALLDDISARYAIPAANYLGHGDVAPGRKVDPGALFPWQTLAEHGYGLWCDDPAAVAAVDFDPLLGLQALGYDVSYPAAASRAFARHFMSTESTGEWMPQASDTLYCLLQKKSMAGE